MTIGFIYHFVSLNFGIGYDLFLKVGLEVNEKQLKYVENLDTKLKTKLNNL